MWWLCLGLAVAAPQLRVGIVVFDEVLTSDVTAPAEVFGAAALEDETVSVQLVHLGPDPVIQTAEGLALRADVALDEAPLFDVLVLPSAMELEPIVGHAPLIAWIGAHAEAGAWLASNCAGAFVLAAAGGLDGHRATTWPGGEALLQDAHPDVIVLEAAPVVVDRRRITSQGGLTSYAASLLLLAQLRPEALAVSVHARLAVDGLVRWRRLQRIGRRGRRVRG